MAEWDELAGNYAENVQSLAAALRALMREIAPDAEENVHLGWKAVGYCFGSGREALAIGLYKAHVNMILFDGIDLDDPQGLLEGTGKRARHVKVRSLKDAEKGALRDLVQQAVALARQGA